MPNPKTADPTARLLASHWPIATEGQVTPIEDGLGQAWCYRAASGERFFVKPAHDVAYLELQELVGDCLAAHGMKGGRLLRTHEGELRAAGLVVQSWMEGVADRHPGPGRLHHLMRYLAQYQRALKALNVPDWVAQVDNPWTRAESLSWLADTLAPDPNPWLSRAADGAGDALGQALELLFVNREKLEELPKQLTHGDLSPGNIHYQEEADEVLGIVDFTPYEISPAYALAVCVYWHALYFADRGSDGERIRALLDDYQSAGGQLTDDELQLFPVLLVRAAVRMLVCILEFSRLHGVSAESRTVRETGCLARALQLVDSP